MVSRSRLRSELQRTKKKKRNEDDGKKKGGGEIARGDVVVVVVGGESGGERRGEEGQFSSREFGGRWWRANEGTVGRRSSQQQLTARQN
jgi:hypothetical protein